MTKNSNQSTQSQKIIVKVNLKKKTDKPLPSRVRDEKFAEDDTHNSTCLTADGCFSRHYASRDSQHLSRQESSNRNFEGSTFEDYKEKQLINMVSYLQSNGFKLLSTDSLERFVDRNFEELSEDHQKTFEKLRF